MFELYEHTADLGLRARAPDLDTLFAEAARALFAAILEDPDGVRAEERAVFDIPGGQREYLLFDWLRELLYCFDAGHRVFGRFQVNTHPCGLSASAWGENFDPARHAVNHAVKAITYHGLRVEQTADGWLAEVIVDI